MKHLRFTFDVNSPYAYLAFERLPAALEACSVEVIYEPIFLGAMLAHWGQKAGAEIPPKREWVYRNVGYTAHSLQLPLQLPAQHPFNPLPLLRLCVACAPAGRTPNRWVCEQVLRHVWCGNGADANDTQRVAALTQLLHPQRDPAGAEVKGELKASTDSAISRGLFGVPNVEVDGRLFWGLEGLELLAAYLRGDAWFDGPDWNAAAHRPPGVQRT